MPVIPYAEKCNIFPIRNPCIHFEECKVMHSCHAFYVFISINILKKCVFMI